MKRYGVAARLAEAGIESLEDRIAPAVFLVTNLADAGAGSLRAAIDGIAGVGGANDSIGADTILFKTGLAGTIHLSSEIPILSSLTIGGNGHVQISGDSVTRILDINAGLIDITVSLQNLTFKDAGSTSYGGAIYSTEDLTISHCKFIGNHTTSYGGAIRQSAGVLKISGSTFLDNS